MKIIESIIIFPQSSRAKPIKIVMEMVTAMPENANALLIMSMHKIAHIMDVSTYCKLLCFFLLFKWIHTSYSKALRCTFLGELKNLCSSKLCIIGQCYVIQCSRFENMCSSRLIIYSRCQCIYGTHLCKNVHLKNSFIKKLVKICKNVHLKFIWTQFKNVHLQGPCSLRPCSSRPYCSWTQLNWPHKYR